MIAIPMRHSTFELLSRLAISQSLILVPACERRDDRPVQVFCSAIYPFETWKGPEGPAECILRTESPESRILLIKGLSYEEVLARLKKPMDILSAFRGIVYRFDPVRRTIENVGEEEWTRAKGQIGGSLPELEPGVPELEMKTQTDRLVYKGALVRTIGRTTLAATVSPDGKLVAVLSAEGTRAESLMPFAGRGGANGQHYHELFRLPGMQPIGKPLPLPVSTERVTMRPIWSGDQGYVVYIDARNSHLCIVGIDLHTGTGP